MPLTNLKSKTGNKKSKRVGRGNASGKGTYSGKGMKGQTARAGGRRRPGFEGGQTPYLRKMPKLKGFKNPNSTEYLVINIGDLNLFEDKAVITKKELMEKNLIAKKNKLVKLLGGKGELTKQVTIHVDKASESAIKAVEAQKGKVEILEKKVKEEEKKTKEKKGLKK
jgi:large subunit ribosomal protein L15